MENPLIALGCCLTMIAGLKHGPGPLPPPERAALQAFQACVAKFAEELDRSSMTTLELATAAKIACRAMEDTEVVAAVTDFVSTGVGKSDGFEIKIRQIIDEDSLRRAINIADLVKAVHSRPTAANR